MDNFKDCNTKNIIKNNQIGGSYAYINILNKYYFVGNFANSYAVRKF